jgi:hypothetical protein
MPIQCSTVLVAALRRERFGEAISMITVLPRRISLADHSAFHPISGRSDRCNSLAKSGEARTERRREYRVNSIDRFTSFFHLAVKDLTAASPTFVEGTYAPPANV